MIVIVKKMANSRTEWNLYTCRTQNGPRIIKNHNNKLIKKLKNMTVRFVSTKIMEEAHSPPQPGTCLVVCERPACAGSRSAFLARMTMAA